MADSSTATPSASTTTPATGGSVQMDRLTNLVEQVLKKQVETTTRLDRLERAVTQTQDSQKKMKEDFSGQLALVAAATAAGGGEAAPPPLSRGTRSFRHGRRSTAVPGGVGLPPMTPMSPGMETEESGMFWQSQAGQEATAASTVWQPLASGINPNSGSVDGGVGGQSTTGGPATRDSSVHPPTSAGSPASAIAPQFPTHHISVDPPSTTASAGPGSPGRSEGRRSSHHVGFADQELISQGIPSTGDIHQQRYASFAMTSPVSAGGPMSSAASPADPLEKSLRPSHKSYYRKKRVGTGGAPLSGAAGVEEASFSAKKQATRRQRNLKGLLALDRGR